MKEAFTYDDVLLLPQKSNIRSRKDVLLNTKLSRNININIPIVSANMDSVTGSNMAISMARLGGIGIVHRFNTIAQQVSEVLKVKNSDRMVIREPYTLTTAHTIKNAKQLMNDKKIKDIIIINKNREVLGMITLRDILFESSDDKKIESVMKAREELITAPENINLEKAKDLFKTYKIKKLPVLNKENKLKGLIMRNDLIDKFTYRNSSLDEKGNLLVGAAIGVKKDDLMRAKALVDAGCDVLVIDIAHGHSDHVISMLKLVKKEFSNVDVIAGNIATGEAAQDLISAGADAVKVGVGPGSLCTTRIVTGSGVPQLSAIMYVYEIAKDQNIPVIADGGLRFSGDIVKALAAGADTIMSGHIFAGTEETPGSTRISEGRKYKVYRGMASLGAAYSRLDSEKDQSLRDLKIQEEELNEYTPEGVESIVPYKGHVQEVIAQILGGVRSGFSYCGAHNIKELQQKTKFVRITPASLSESFYHDVKKI